MAKQGMTLQELAVEVKRQADTKNDYRVQSRSLATHSNGQTVLDIPTIGQFPMTDLAHQQLASHLGIPMQYYKTLRSDFPTLLDQNANTLLAARPADERRLVRTLDTNARALLSDRYRILDNYDLLKFLLPDLGAQRDLEFHSLALTENKIYLKVTTPRLTFDVQTRAHDIGKFTPRPVQMGLVISNSEVGSGALSVLPWTLDLICSNGAVHENYGKRRAHLGRLLGGNGNDDQDVLTLYTSETLEADNRAFFLKVRDVVRGLLSEQGDAFKAIAQQMNEAAGVKIERNPEKVVEVLAKRADMSEGERGDVLAHLIEGGDLSMFGLSSAINRAAQDVESYDRATDLETLAGRVITLDKTEWREIMTAAAA